MSQTVYKFWRINRSTEAWEQLSREEQDALFEQVGNSLAGVGGKWLVRCDSYWANEACIAWGVDQFPNLEAAVTHGENLRKINWNRYLESETILGTPIAD